MAHRLRFRHRIAMLLGLAAISLVIVTVVTLLFGRESERQLAGIETSYVPLIELDRDLKAAFAAIPRAFEDAASAGEEGRLGQAVAASEQFTQRLAAAAPAIAANGGDAPRLQGEFRTYYLAARDITTALISGAAHDQLAAKIVAMQRTREEFSADLDTATRPDRAALATAFTAARDAHRTAFLVDTAIALGALALMGALSWALIRTTVQRLRGVAAGMERLARGEFGQPIEVGQEDELGDVAREANRTAERLRDFTDAISREDWIKSGVGGLGAELAGEHDTSSLGGKAMAYLAKYLGAPVGVVYAGDDSGAFRRLASYGTAAEAPEAFRSGETVLGQAARDDELRVLAVAPEYLTMASALGAMPPRSVVIVPFSHEGRAMGVLELALPEPPTEPALELLRRCRGTLGVAFRVAESRERARLLLEETVRTQHMLEERAAEIARASKYKSDFLANMSHELRTPLNSIMILSKVLAEGDQPADKRIELANLIHRSGDDLLVLINDVLDLSKVEAGKQQLAIEPVALAGLAEYTRGMFAPLAAQRELGFDVELADGLPEAIRTDRTRVQQIIKNLVANALKFTERGRIAVWIEPVSLDAVAIAVSDTGIGIAHDQQQVIFDAFAQAERGTSRKYGGTGLGLTIAKELAQRLGGRIEIASQVGQGSTFRVVLPIAGPPAGESISSPIAEERVSAASIPVVDDDPRLDGKTVLIVDDDMRNVYTLSSALRANRLRVLTATDPREALEELERHPDTSAVLMDVTRPNLEGPDAMRRIRDQPRFEKLPIIALTAKLGEREQCLAWGASDHLAKPIDLGRLVELLRVYLN